MVISIFEITSCGFLHQCYKTNLAKLIKKKTGLINRESNSWVTVGGGRTEIIWQVKGLGLQYPVGVVLRTSGGGVSTWQAFWSQGLVKQKWDLNRGHKRGWETESFHPNRGLSPESKHTCTLITDVIPDLGENKFLLVKFLSLVFCDISLRQVIYT